MEWFIRSTFAVQYDLEKRTYWPVILGALHCARVAGCFFGSEIARKAAHPKQQPRTI